MGKQCKQWDFTILGSKITADGGWSHEIRRRWLLGGNAMTNLDRVLKSRYIANKSASSQSYVSFSSHVWMWELEHKEGWVPNNWCFWTVVLEKTLESPLDRRKIKPVNPEGRQHRIFIGRTDAEAEVSILWPPDAKNWFIGKDPDAGKDQRQEEKGMTEDEMVGWHHRLNGRELSKLWQMVKNREAWPAAVHGVTKSWTWLSNWTTNILWRIFKTIQSMSGSWESKTRHIALLFLSSFYIILSKFFSFLPFLRLCVTFSVLVAKVWQVRFTHLFNKCLLNCHHKWDAVLGTKDSSVNRTRQKNKEIPP